MKRILGILFGIMLLVSCNSQKVYSDFDISYSKSGGYAPIYENLLIKDQSVHYSFEGNGKKYKTNFKLTSEEIQQLHQVFEENNFRQILEDRKKIKDHVSIIINVKNGDNSGSKTDASMIMPKYKHSWDNIVKAFQEIINTNVKNNPSI